MESHMETLEATWKSLTLITLAMLRPEQKPERLLVNNIKCSFDP